MKRLAHLLWIVPLLLVVAAVTLNRLASRALDRDRAFHQALSSTIQVNSDDVDPLGEIPVEFTCAGEGLSPHIAWTAGPEGTRSYAVIATDWDAPSPSFRMMAVTHWVLFDIPAGVREIPRNIGSDGLGAEGVTVGAAMGGRLGYVPPCPPLGRHAYRFRVYALDVDAITPGANGGGDVLAAMDGHVLGYGELIGFRAAN